MEQLEEFRSQAPEINPQGPIVVLGKRQDYLFVGITLDQVIEDACTHSPAGSNHLILDVELFDSTGRPLDPTVTTGELNLVNEEFVQMIRDRIEGIFLAPATGTVEQHHGTEPGPGKEPTSPGAPLIPLLRQAFPRKLIRKLGGERCPRWKCWFKLCKC